MAITATYVDIDTFTVVDNRTVEFAVGRRVKCDCGTDGYKYGTISVSSYSSPDTTVDLTAGSDNLTSNLVGVWYAIVLEGVSGSLPIHTHDGAEGSGGNVDVDDTPVNGETTTPVSSNWAFDHDADTDAHHPQGHTVASHSDTTTTGTELNHVGGVTSAIQTQLDAKAPIAGPTFTGLIKKSATAAITAFATGGQASAVELTSDINEVSVCAAGGDSVKLPAGIAGMEIMVVNHGAAAMDLFPATGDFLNELSVNVAVSIAVNATAIAYCYVADYWEVTEVARA